MDLDFNKEVDVLWWQNGLPYFILVGSNNTSRFAITPEGAHSALFLFSEDELTYTNSYKTPISYILKASTASWLELLTNHFHNHPQTSLQITLPPSDFMEAEAVNNLRSALEHLNNTLLHKDVNAHIPVLAHTLPLAADQRRHINRAQRVGISCEQVHPGALGSVWSLIERNRADKKYVLGVTQDDLAAQIRAFPQFYTLLGAYSGQHELIAAIILVELAPGHFYTFLTAHASHAQSISPLVPLHAYTYSYVLERGGQILDLGTCSLQGVVNQGVMNFKASLGAHFSIKSTYLVTAHNATKAFHSA